MWVAKGVSLSTVCTLPFLVDKLKLNLHPDKVSIRTFNSGVDFLGWVHFPDYRVPRLTTKKRMLERLKAVNYSESSLQSYLGLLGYGNTHNLRLDFLYNSELSCR